MGVQMQENRFGGYVQTHVDQVELFQSLHSLAVLNQRGQIGSHVAVLDGDGGDFSFDALQELDQTFHLFFEADVCQRQGMEIILVHLDEFANEIRGEVLHIFDVERFDIVVFEMTFSFVWAVRILQEFSCLRLEMGQNEFFYHQVFPAFLLDCLFLGLVYVIISFNYQIFNEIVIMKKFYQIISTISIKLVVLHIKIEKIGVVSKSFRKV